MSASEIETKARAMGWRPKDQFVAQGRPESHWVDAEAYVERGEQILPMLQANNKKLLKDLSEVQQQNRQISEQLKSATEAIDALKDLRTTLNVDKAKQQKSEILEQIKEAKTSGDVDAEVALTDKLSEVNTALREAAKPAAKLPEPRSDTPTLTEEAKEWMSANPWFGNGKENDAGKTGYAMGLAQAWAREGKRTGTKEFFEHVDEKLAEVFDQNRQRRESGGKVNETTNSERTDGGTPGKSYSDLPREAKEACERFAKRLVGPDKVYKNITDFRKNYAANYDWS